MYETMYLVPSSCVFDFNLFTTHTYITLKCAISKSFQHILVSIISQTDSSMSSASLIRNAVAQRRYFVSTKRGLPMVGNLKNVKPGTAADWKTNVQDNNQKSIDVCPARTTAAMLLMMKITTSCPNIAKPHVGCRLCTLELLPIFKVLPNN